MDSRTKEFIAVGADCLANCVPRLEFHVKKGREAGLSDDAFRDAISVGRMVKRGAARKWDEFAADLLGSESGDSAAVDATQAN